MNFVKINNWLQVVANVGIVVGLLLVGLQLKQNSDLLKTQLLFEESKRAVDLETLVIGEDAADAWAKSITDPENLTLAEQRQMEALLWSYSEQLRATRMLAALGLLDDDDWRLRVQGESGYFFGSRYARAWWTNYSNGNNALYADLITAVNDRLAEVEEDYTVNYTHRVIERLKQENADTVDPAE